MYVFMYFALILYGFRVILKKKATFCVPALALFSTVQHCVAFSALFNTVQHCVALSALFSLYNTV
jgi:hypothetical protein